MVEAIAPISIAQQALGKELLTNNRSAKSVTVLMDPLTNKNLIESMHTPPAFVGRWLPVLFQKWGIGTHSKMNTRVDAVSNAMTKMAKMLRIRLKDLTGKMRYWNRMLFGTETS